MSERIINSAWRLVIIGLLFILGAAAMFQLYQGVLDLFAGHLDRVIAPVILGILMSGAVYWLARHREDLVEF